MALEKKTLLPIPFQKNWFRLPEFLNQTNQNLEELIISKTIAGELDIDTVTLTKGTPLIIGKKYYLDNLGAGDNFTNVGFTVVGNEFIATATTPTVWNSNSTIVYYLKEGITPSFNSVDDGIYVTRTGITIDIKITNGSFINGKTFPNIIGASNINVIDTNTIRFTNQFGSKYFKIEVFL